MYPSLMVLMLALTVNCQQFPNTKLTELFKWKQVDFQFPNETLRNDLLNSSKYIPANNSILGLEVWRNKMFLTVPRWYYGTGSTLNYVNLDNQTQSPLLIPYPDYASNDIYNGNLDNKIISTTRIFVDTCNRLWVPDNGQDGIFTDAPVVLSSQKLLIFDLTTNTLLRKVTMDNTVTDQLSGFYEVIVDITNNDCDTAYGYLADTSGYGILVYSWETNTFSRVTNSYMYFEPQSSVFNNKIQFQDGVIGMALSSVNNDGFKTLYFHALASFNEYKVSTQVLQDPNLSSDFSNFQLIGNRGEKSQSTTQRLDERTGVVFYTQVQKYGIGCWNSMLNPLEYTTATNGMAAVDRERLSFPSALILDIERNNIFVLSDNLLNFLGSTLDSRDYNYRVLYASVGRLIEDTVCNTVSNSSSN